ncbi:MAG: metal-sensitive transcriptional regulator [Leptospirales bacterium]|nr:metal-sensitive transcriptional regulator [Leptospirales bacterium]
MEPTELIHRLNRIQGQIEAIKRSLQSEKTDDCRKNILLVKAATNALKKFGNAYVEAHLDQCVANKTSARQIEKELRSIIASAFAM